MWVLKENKNEKNHKLYISDYEYELLGKFIKGLYEPYERTTPRPEYGYSPTQNTK